MNKFNRDLVIQTLQKVVEVLEENHVEYRIIGSVVVAAINGKLHRKLGDMDLIIDIGKKDVLYKALKSLGYKEAKGKVFAFGRKYYCLETLDHQELLEVGYFYGTWQKDGSFLIGNKYVNVCIEDIAVKETEYKLHGIRFKGIPKRIAATNIMTSKSNPKRQSELLILKKKNIAPSPNNFIHINIFGVNADWMYHFGVAILNTWGNIRVKLGLAFDPWR